VSEKATATRKSGTSGHTPPEEKLWSETAGYGRGDGKRCFIIKKRVRLFRRLVERRKKGDDRPRGEGKGKKGEPLHCFWRGENSHKHHFAISAGEEKGGKENGSTLNTRRENALTQIRLGRGEEEGHILAPLGGPKKGREKKKGEGK